MTTIGITGASGFIGKHFLKKLLEDGYSVNAYARDKNSIEFLRDEEHAFNIFEGDIADEEKLSAFVCKSDIVIHLAAGTRGEWKDFYNATVKGSELLLKLCEKHKIKKLIYISSISIYDILSAKSGKAINEEAPLEPYLDTRGWYAKAKALGEALISKKLGASPVPVIILRPGLVYAANMRVPLMGCGVLRNKLCINLGMRTKRLPFVHIDDLYGAVKLSIEKNVENKIYNVVSDEQPSIDRIVAVHNELAPPCGKVKTLYVPKILFAFNHILRRLLSPEKKLGRYNYIICRTQKNIYYSAEKIKSDLGWKASVSFRKAMEQIADYQYSKVNIGIVGCGFASQTLHAPAILNNPRLKVKVLFDTDKDAALDLKKRFFGDAVVLDSMGELKSTHYPLDFIVINTPPETHFKLAKKLIEEGYNLLIEKPITLDAGEAAQLATLAQEHGVKVCVVNNYRFRKNVLAFKEALHSEAPTRPESFTIKFWSGPLIESSGGWRSSMKNVLLYDMAYHFIDIVLGITGNVREINYLDSQYAKNGFLTTIHGILSTDKNEKIYLDLQLNPPYAQAAIEACLSDHAYMLGFFPESFRRLGGSFNPVGEIKNNLKTVIKYAVDNKIRKQKNFSHQCIYRGFVQSLKNSCERLPITINDTLPVMDLIEKIASQRKKV